jgi:hypothetical protein
MNTRIVGIGNTFLVLFPKFAKCKGNKKIKMFGKKLCLRVKEWWWWRWWWCW